MSAITGAMTALGLPPENAAVVQKATSILSSSIDVVLSLTASTINPLTAISSVSGLVTSIFGSSRSQPDPVLEYLKHIDKKLDYIISQNDRLAEGQGRIIKYIKDISENQVEITKQIQGVSQSVLINRSLITSIVTGPIKRIEDQIINEPSMQALINLDFGYVTYDDLSEAFSVSGDRIFAAMRQLEELFSSDSDLHPIFLSSTYENSSRVSISIREEISEILVEKSAVNGGRSTQEILSERISEWPPELDLYYATEFASFGPLLIGNELLDRNKVAIPKAYEKLIDVSSLVGVANVAIVLCKLYPFVTFEGGWRLKKEDEILKANAIDETGFRILQRILNWIEVSIAQSNIVSDSYRNIEPKRWIDKQWMGTAAAVAEATVLISKGLFDLRWFDQVQSIFWQYERGSNILEWMPCEEAYSPPRSPSFCGKRIGASEDEILGAINEWLGRFDSYFKRIGGTVEVEGFWPVVNGVELTYNFSKEEKFAFPYGLRELDVEWMSGLVPWINAKRNMEKIQGSSIDASAIYEMNQLLEPNRQGYLDGEAYVQDYPRDGYFPIRYDTIGFRDFARKSALSGHWTRFSDSDVLKFSLAFDNDHWGISLIYKDISFETSVLLDLKSKIIQGLTPKTLVDHGMTELSSRWRYAVQTAS